MRTRLGLLLAVALTVLAPVAVVPHASASTADKVAVGYRIRVDGTAGGGWIGARKVWPRLVYRLDPGARRVSTPGFGPAHRVRQLHGSGPNSVTRRDTARAAYLLSAYGTRRDHPAQNAAVEVALDQLLVGGRYGRHGSTTLARMRPTGNAAEIGFLADYMLQDSRDFAGPYRVSLTHTGTTLGGYAHVGVRVTAKLSGQPFPTLPVIVSIPGKKPRILETDSDGRVSVSWHATRAGLLDVRVKVKEVPETRLLVRTPTRRGASRIAIAGVKRSLVRHVRVPVKAHPTVSVAQPAAARIGTPTSGVLTVAHGVDSPRDATATLFGPYAAAADAACAGASVGSGVVEVTADGGYALPGLAISDVGYYVWGVQVAGNQVNEPAATCGTALVARTVPRLTIKVPDNRVALGSTVRAWWTVAKLPPDFSGMLRIRLYGPFADADHVSCSGQTGRSERVAITGQDGAWSTSYTPTRSGLYAWRSTLPGSEFSTWSATTCGGAGTLVRIVR